MLVLKKLSRSQILTVIQILKLNTFSSSDQISQLDKFSWSDQKSQQDIFSSVDQNDQVVKSPSKYIVVLKIIIA